MRGRPASSRPGVQPTETLLSGQVTCWRAQSILKSGKSQALAGSGQFPYRTVQANAMLALAGHLQTSADIGRIDKVLFGQHVSGCQMLVDALQGADVEFHRCTCRYMRDNVYRLGIAGLGHMHLVAQPLHASFGAVVHLLDRCASLCQNAPLHLDLVQLAPQFDQLLAFRLIQ